MYAIGKELGTGTFGVVRQVEQRQTGERFALKTINKEKLDDHQMKYLEAECEVLKQVDDHPNIVKMHEIYDTPKKLHIVMELVTGGQLLERLATKGLYSEAVTAQCIRSITEALAYCHSKGVVHRDLKPENILLSDDTDDASIKLADFGLSKLYNAETEMMFTQCGTPEFVAPEVMATTGYSEACDIWSLGVMMYIMLCGYLPFNGSNITELFELIATSTIKFPAEEWDMISPEAKLCNQAMLARDPKAVRTFDAHMTKFSKEFLLRTVTFQWKTTIFEPSTRNPHHNSISRGVSERQLVCFSGRLHRSCCRCHGSRVPYR